MQSFTEMSCGSGLGKKFFLVANYKVLVGSLIKDVIYNYTSTISW